MDNVLLIQLQNQRLVRVAKQVASVISSKNGLCMPVDSFILLFKIDKLDSSFFCVFSSIK